MIRHKKSKIELKRYNTLHYGGWHNDSVMDKHGTEVTYWHDSKRYGSLRCKLIRNYQHGQIKFGFWWRRYYLVCYRNGVLAYG